MENSANSQNVAQISAEEQSATYLAADGRRSQTRESGADFETKFKCPVWEDLLQFIKTFVLYRIFEEIFCVLT
jgi:hypothetical protein